MALALLLPAATGAATPSPDPPPLPAPDPVPAQTTKQATTRASEPRVSPAPVTAAPTVASTPRVVAPARPVVTKPGPTSKPKPRPRATKPVARPQPVVRIPHDRGPVPLAAFVPADEFDRGLLTAAGIVLLLTALGGAVVLGTARRQLVAAASLMLIVPAASALAPPASYSLAGTSGANGWYVGNVTISFTWTTDDLISTSGCDTKLISTEGINTPPSCVVRFTWGDVTLPPADVTVKIDKTVPTSVSGSLVRSPDSNGWYNRPVAATFNGQDGVSGLAGCASPSYAGGDSTTASLAGTCTDVAGNTSASVAIAFKYDATPPTVSVAADRAPDTKGWYRRPVTIAFTGADAVSGVAACTESTRYAGPDRPDAAVAGTCRDAAGNVAPEQKLVLRYDATAPRVSSARARVERGVAHVTWKRPADVAAIEIERKPGVNGRAASIVYQGQGQAFVDRTVKPGSVYRYEIRAADEAGNVGSLAVSTGQTATQPLQRPAAGATVRGPVVLGWAAVKGARFYNVQLYRGGKKILSTWPNATSLRLARSWRYAGERQRLVPGLYRWYVWAARGTRERPTYSRVLGSSTFRVVR